ncbi:glycoside hydrolase family 28 protein [Mucilaginibacter aquatilis]|uniref:Glycoside hydrolase family 28 protein n=1 Tax=Mucilaginibacter aquatilis TaxID=1517760 RepID=A0A6I4IQD7_9SPHI|nr:glycoside hydrolase family 28 protein [Mucilaginibacter aquatilis]MVN90974.1 glycoside hydrolase family 28 protein [Mucilaginibacter aquatilis]
MRKHIIFLVNVVILFASLAAWANDPSWVKAVGAKSFPAKTKEYAVTNFGAVADGKTLNTRSIQQAIDKCSASGGGVVRVKAGKYLTGSLFIKSNVNFMIDEGAELLGSQNINDYPEIDTRVAGIEMKWPAALLNVLNQKNAAITGKGLVNAQGKPFWDMYWNLRKEYEPKGLRWIVDYDAKRPRTLLVSNSANVTVKGITLQQAGFWTVQLLYSNQVTVDGVIIRNNVEGHGPSTDGIDVDSSTRVLIENCDIDCNDDNFCLKAGRDWDGLRVNKPTEYVVIRNCVARAGAGLLTLGSETSGGIRHVLATNLTGNGTSNGLNLKSATTRGGVLEDIHFKNITLNNVGTAFQITLNWNPAYSYSKLPEGYDEKVLPAHWKAMLTPVEPASKGVPRFQNVFVSNIKATAKKAVNAAGLPESQLLNFQFDNVQINAKTAGSIKYAQNWKWNNSTVAADDGTQLVIP